MNIFLNIPLAPDEVAEVNESDVLSLFIKDEQTKCGIKKYRFSPALKN